jgi:hypothetical protein
MINRGCHLAFLDRRLNADTHCSQELGQRASDEFVAAIGDPSRRYRIIEDLIDTLDDPACDVRKLLMCCAGSARRWLWPAR